MAELKDKWEKLKEELEAPSKLSETEKKKITGVFEGMRELLDENLEIILGLGRSDAYRYTNLILQALMTADANYMAGVTSPGIITEVEKQVELGPRPDIHSILSELSEEERSKAEHLLDCVKAALQLHEEGDPRYNEALCYGLDRICNAEEMRKCIRTEDPTIRDMEFVEKR